MPRCLITGARGFVGRRLMGVLPSELPGLDLIAAASDVTDPAALTDEVAAAAPDVCIHLAAVSAVADAQRDPDTAWRVNLHGALNVARAIMAGAPGCLLVHASSAEAYGTSFRAGAPLTEDAPLAPANAYAATKAASDLALGAMVPAGLRVVRLRLFNHTGPGQTDAFVVPAFARQIARIEAGLQPPVLSVGNLDAARDFLDVDDVCAAYAACVRRAADIPSGTILNIASGAPRTVRSVLDDLLRLTAAQIEVRQDPARLRPSDTPFAAGDSARARAVLGWSPQVPWATTVARVLDDWRARTAAGAG